jgi:IS30 family transposase
MGRPSLPRSRRRAFWREVVSAASPEEAAARVGVSGSAGRRWFTEAGGVKPDLREPSGRYLSQAERDAIDLGLAEGRSHAEIARGLGRHRGTIGREIRRNATAPRRAGGRCHYRASTAQARAEQRARRPKQTKLADSPQLLELVQTRLTRRWSPEMISAMLRREFPDQPELHVSHETIYRALYVQGRGELRRELARCLRTGRAIRKPRRQVGERRGRIPNMVMISQRPPEVADRAVPGDWEGDLILGKDGRSAIGTLVERTTRYLMLLHLPDRHDATAVRDAILAALPRLPAQLRKSLTWDQGAEMARHAEITLALDLPIYFCDPASPWQRPSNENTNGLLRQYFPKGTDLSVYSQAALDAVANEVNQRPRKVLDWQTPAQAFDQLLSTH